MEKFHNGNDENKGTLTNGTSENLENANVKPERNKSKLSKEKKILAGVALTLAVGIGGGMAANFAFNHHPASAISASSSENVSENNKTSETSSNNEASSVNNSSENSLSSQTQEALPTVESLEIPANLSAEEFANDFIKDINSWTMAGTTTENYDKYKEVSAKPIPTSQGGYMYIGVTNYGQQVAKQYTDIYAKALFTGQHTDDIDTDKSNAGVYIRNFESENAYCIAEWLATYKSGSPYDKEPYSEYLTVTNVEEISPADNIRTIKVTATLHDNASKNTAKRGVSDDNGKTYIYSLVTATFDGHEKIDSINIGNTGNN